MLAVGSVADPREFPAREFARQHSEHFLPEMRAVAARARGVNLPPFVKLKSNRLQTARFSRHKRKPARVTVGNALHAPDERSLPVPRLKYQLAVLDAQRPFEFREIAEFGAILGGNRMQERAKKGFYLLLKVEQDLGIRRGRHEFER